MLLCHFKVIFKKKCIHNLLFFTANERKTVNFELRMNRKIKMLVMGSMFCVCNSIYFYKNINYNLVFKLL